MSAEECVLSLDMAEAEAHHARLHAELRERIAMDDKTNEAMLTLRAEIGRLRAENEELWQMFNPIRTAAYELEQAVAARRAFDDSRSGANSMTESDSTALPGSRREGKGGESPLLTGVCPGQNDPTAMRTAPRGPLPPSDSRSARETADKEALYRTAPRDGVRPYPSGLKSGGPPRPIGGGVSAVAGFLLTLGLVLAFGVGGVGTAEAYYAYQYPIDQANGFVDLAAATNNLSETLVNLNHTLLLLAPYHGNPNRLFPTAHTNFDLIKQQISTTIQSAEKVVGQTPDSFAYQQALKNIQSDLTTTIEGELNDAGSILFYWSFGWCLWFVFPGAIICWILAVAFWRD